MTETKEIVDAYRLKIKKLKYKIEKEEKAKQELMSMRNKSTAFESQYALRYDKSVATVFSKANFYLSLKGLNLQDIFRGTDRNGSGNLNNPQFMRILEGMKLPLDKDEWDIVKRTLRQGMSLSIFRKAIEQNKF